MEKFVLLTFDLEEFDIPCEFGHPVPEDEQLSVSVNGLRSISGLLEKHNIPVTFFTTSTVAEHIPDLVKSLSASHEIASHSRAHTGHIDSDPYTSRKILEEMTGREIEGFRMPRFSGVDLKNLKSAGYKYDSSVNPTIIPGRYNNFFSERKPFIDADSSMIEFPLSVSPVLRFPLFWLSFKNFPLPAYLFLCRQTLNKDSYIHLYFHTWEFAGIDGYGLPRYVKSISGNQLLEKLEKLINELNKSATFITVSAFLEHTGLKKKNN